jgi:uncharacterized protein
MAQPPARQPRSDSARGAGRSPNPEGLVRLDLRSLDVPSGAARAIDAAVPIDPLEIGGQPYVAVPGAPVLHVDLVRLATGWHFRLRGAVDVVGPCWRCLEPSRVAVALDTTEVSIDGADDPEMISLFVHSDELAVAEWARDAVAEALPATILCTDDCAGLCPSCGTNLNEGLCTCVPEAVDTRWAALADLARRLADGEPDGRPDGG